MLRYAITDRTLHGQEEAARRAGLLRQAAYLAREGVEFLQLREKDLSARALAALARDLLRELGRHAPDRLARPRLLVNSRVDVALASRADGVHLTSGAGQLAAGQVRGLYAGAGLGKPRVSVSCHTLDEVRRAAGGEPENRPNVILFGPVFEKRIAAGEALPGGGLELLREACAAAAPIPLLALGGVTAQTAPECVAAGAGGIAAIRMFLP